MRTLLDIDGVVCRFTDPVTAAVNRITGKSFTDDDITQWDIFAAFGVSKEVADEVTAIIRAPGFCAGLEPYPGAREGVAALRLLGDVYPVTSPFDSDHWIRERQLWLERFGFDHASVVHTAAKHVVTGNFLIDDKTSTLVKWQAHNPGGVAILFTRPWNRADEWPGVRVSNWEELIEAVRARS